MNIIVPDIRPGASALVFGRLVAIGLIEKNVFTRVMNCFSAHERLVWCLFSDLRCKEENDHQNNTRVGAKNTPGEYIHYFISYTT